MRIQCCLPLFVAILAILFFWEMAALFMARPMLPGPFPVVCTFFEIFESKILLHAGWSLLRVVEGVILAVVIGVPPGILMGYFPRADRYLSPMVYLTYPVPKIALLPILMLLVGIGELSKVQMMALIIVFQVVISVRDGVRTVPAQFQEPLISLGAGFWQIFCHVLLPATLPKFLTALRVAMATAISVLFFTETFGTQYGMGFFIMDAWLRVNYLEMYAGIFALSIMGLFLFAVLDFAEAVLCKWQTRGKVC